MVRALMCGLGLGAILSPVGLVGEEQLANFLKPEGRLPKTGALIEAFKWRGDQLYLWDGQAFQIWDASDWSAPKLVGEVPIGAPVEYRMDDRIGIVGSKAYLYDAEAVWISNSEGLTAPPKYRTVIDIVDPMVPAIDGQFDSGSMFFATSGPVAVASFIREGATIHQIADSGDLVKRSQVRDSGIPTIIGERVYLYNEGTINVVNIADIAEPQSTRLRAERERDYSFSKTVFWGDYFAEGGYWRSELRVWDAQNPETARQIATLEFDAKSVVPLVSASPFLYVKREKTVGPSTILAIDISDPATPVAVAESELGSSVHDFQVVGSKAVILQGGHLQLFEIEIPRLSEAAYRNWQERFFPVEAVGSVADPEADPDRDGLSNWMEFALGRKPLNREPLPLALSFKGNRALVSYDRRTDVASWFDYVIETSPSLAPGNWEPVPEERMVGELFGVEFYEADLPEGHRYARLRVGEK